MARFDTHDIFNQSPPYEDVDLFASDRRLQEAVAANGAGGEAAALGAFGRHWGTAAMFERRGSPTRTRRSCKTFDTKGFRRDTVEFHPGLSRLHGREHRGGLHASTWQADGIARRSAGRGRARGALSSWWRRSRTATCARSP